MIQEFPLMFINTFLSDDLQKVKVVPVRNSAPCYKDAGGVEVQLHTFLTAVLYGREWSASYPDRCIPTERAERNQ